ncbi:MAG: chemotaxis protein CheW [Bacillota bacterium]
MAGRGGKKSKDNFEKLKREIAVKRQKAESKQKPEALMEAGGDAEKEIAEDVSRVVQRDEKENTADAKRIELVVFRVDEEEFAMKVSNIKEIIRVPPMARVPNAPCHITGLCSLRGELMPVIDSRKLFGMPGREFAESSRIIVAEIHGKKVGLTSDKVLEVINVEEAAVKEPPAGIKGIDGGVVSGILMLDGGKRVVMVLDAEKIAGAWRASADENRRRTWAESLKDTKAKENEEAQIIIFSIGSGEYAFHIDCVSEIIRMPDIIKAPDAASHIEGVFSIRNNLLAAVNPARLLGVDCKRQDEQSRVVILNNGSFSYGVMVDKVSHVVRVRKELFNERGRIANCSGAEHVKGIFSLDGGKRLVMLLDPQKLAAQEEVKAVPGIKRRETEKSGSSTAYETDNNLEHIVAFKLGEEEYGIEINNVQEINRLDDITRFPGAPSFISGMLDLRGDIIPILNLASFFAVDGSGSNKASKFLVVEYGKKRIGILIDSVSGVLRFSRSCVEEAPGVFGGSARNGYVDSIAKLNEGKRIILILNLAALLSFMQG